MELHNESSKKKALKWKSAADTPLSKKLKLGEMSDESDDDIDELWDEETSEAESDEEEEDDDDDDEDFSEEEKQKVLSTPKKDLKASKSESALKKDYSSERKLNKSASERQFSETPSTAKSKVTSLSEKKNKPKDESNPDSNSSQNGEPSQTEPGKKKKKKKKKNAEGSEDVAQQTHSQTPSQKVPVKKVLSGGTIMEEVKIGHGPEAKEGKVVHVYYAGNLLNNGKQFDSKLRGQPFKFRLGKRSYSGLGCWFESWWKTKINSSSKSRIRQTGTHSSQQHSCV